MHRVIRRIAAQGFVNALIQGHWLARGPGGHVGLGWEGGQLVDQAALLGLEVCSGVMGDKTGQALLAMATKETGAVDWMEAKPVQRRGIADVM